LRTAFYLFVYLAKVSAHYTHTRQNHARATQDNARNKLPAKEGQILRTGRGHLHILHDLGKIVATQVQEDGRITAYGHEVLGLPTVEKQLRRLTNHQKLIAYVLNQTELHMRPNKLAQSGSRKKKTRMMFDLSVCPEDLILLSRADASGKLDEPYREENETWLRERLEDYRDRLAQPMVTGSDLIAAGLKPDRHFSDLIRRARMLHFAGIDRKNALRQVVAEAEAQKMQENMQNNE
jgi:tRNA nucleotidyltransferase (CCA-adding enzyme)